MSKQGPSDERNNGEENEKKSNFNNDIDFSIADEIMLSTTKM